MTWKNKVEDNWIPYPSCSEGGASGGNTGEVLKKVSNTDNDYTWSSNWLPTSSTISELNKLASTTVTTTELNKLDGLTVNSTKLNYCGNLTSNIMDQVRTKKGWTGVEVTIVNGFLSTSTNTAYTLSFLPNNYTCEVMITGFTTSKGYNQGYITVNMTSDVLNNSELMFLTESGQFRHASGCIIFPVSSSKKIYLKNTGDNKGEFHIVALGYRRIGNL